MTFTPDGPVLHATVVTVWVVFTFLAVAWAVVATGLLREEKRYTKASRSDYYACYNDLVKARTRVRALEIENGRLRGCVSAAADALRKAPNREDVP